MTIKRTILIGTISAEALAMGGCKIPAPLNNVNTGPASTPIVQCTDVPAAYQPDPTASANTPQYAVVVTCGTAAPFTTDQGSLADQGITITNTWKN